MKCFFVGCFFCFSFTSFCQDSTKHWSIGIDVYNLLFSEMPKRYVKEITDFDFEDLSFMEQPEKFLTIPKYSLVFSRTAFKNGAILVRCSGTIYNNKLTYRINGVSDPSLISESLNPFYYLSVGYRQKMKLKKIKIIVGSDIFYSRSNSFFDWDTFKNNKYYRRKRVRDEQNLGLVLIAGLDHYVTTNLNFRLETSFVFSSRYFYASLVEYDEFGKVSGGIQDRLDETFYGFRPFHSFMLMYHFGKSAKSSKS